MNTKLVNSAAGVINAALMQNRTAAGIALALDSARLLQSPETAADHAQLQDDIAGACLARWEEEQDNARLRLAWESARRDRRALRARVAELERQLADYTEPDVDGAGRTYESYYPEARPSVKASTDELTALLAPTQALREDEPLIVDADGSEPTPLRWGLNDVMWGDDDSVIVMLSGPQGEPYWLELEADRATVLRQDLGGAEAAEMGGAPC